MSVAVHRRLKSTVKMVLVVMLERRMRQRHHALAERKCQGDDETDRRPSTPFHVPIVRDVSGGVKRGLLAVFVLVLANGFFVAGSRERSRHGRGLPRGVSASFVDMPPMSTTPPGTDASLMPATLVGRPYPPYLVSL